MMAVCHVNVITFTSPGYLVFRRAFPSIIEYITSSKWILQIRKPLKGQIQLIPREAMQKAVGNCLLPA